MLAALISGCSDDQVSPVGNNNGGGNGEFTIVSVDKDTAYWGESVTVRYKGTTTDSLTLFLHTLPLPIDSLWHNSDGTRGLRFYLPWKTSSGQIRLYEHDTIVAKGSHTLVVVERFIDKGNFNIFSIRPWRGYAGDTLVITGFGIPKRRRDIGVSIEGADLPILSSTDTTITAMITDAVRTGSVALRLFDSTVELATFIKHERGADLNEFVSLRGIRLFSAGLNGVLWQANINAGDTTVTETRTDLENIDWSLAIPTLYRVPHPDSIIFAGESYSNDKILLCEIHLKELPDNRMSGTIYIRRGNFGEWMAIEIELNAMRWYKNESSYSFYVESGNIQNELGKYIFERISEPVYMSKQIYESADPASVFMIELDY